MADGSSSGGGNPVINKNCVIGKRVIVVDRGLITTIVGHGNQGFLILENCETKARAGELIFLTDGLSEDELAELYSYFAAKKGKHRETIMPKFAKLAVTEIEPAGKKGEWTAKEGDGEAVLDKIKHNRVVTRPGGLQCCVCCGGEVEEDASVDRAAGDDEAEENSGTATATRKRKASETDDDLEGEEGDGQSSKRRVTMSFGGEGDGEDEDLRLCIAPLADVEAYQKKLERENISAEEVFCKMQELCNARAERVKEQNNEILLGLAGQQAAEFKRKEVDPEVAKLRGNAQTATAFIKSGEDTLEAWKGNPNPPSWLPLERLTVETANQRKAVKGMADKMEELEGSVPKKFEEVYEPGKKEFGVSKLATPDQAKKRTDAFRGDLFGARDE